MPEESTADVRVWDLPTRLFHWALVLGVGGSLTTGWLGALEWHFRCGYAVLTLVGFRLLWGVVGGRWSRFASFLYSPAALWRHVRRRPRTDERPDVGHSPSGALSVFAVLGLLSVQLATGLVANDDASTVGPLNRWVSNALASQATGWHAGWGQWLIAGTVVLHIAAIAFYQLRLRVDLVGPMLWGDKALPADTPSSADGLPQRLLAALVLAGCAGAAAWVSWLGG